MYFCVFYCKLEGIPKYFKRFVISRKIHLCMPQILMSTFEVALQLEFQFAPGTTRKFHSLHLFHCLQTVSLLAGFSVQLEPMSSKAMSTLGTEELGTRNSEHLTAISTRSNFKYIVDQHKSVSRVDRAQMKIPLPPFNKKRNKRKISHTHTHTKIEMLPSKAD